MRRRHCALECMFVLSCIFVTCSRYVRQVRDRFTELYISVLQNMRASWKSSSQQWRETKLKFFLATPGIQLTPNSTMKSTVSLVPRNSLYSETPRSAADMAATPVNTTLNLRPQYLLVVLDFLRWRHLTRYEYKRRVIKYNNQLLWQYLGKACWLWWGV